jgi:cytidylate kinase
MIIAIDGPAGSGKSTTAKLLADKLRFIYLDTGAMYRAVTLFLLNNRIDINNNTDVQRSLEKIDLSIKNENKFEVYLNSQNVTNNLRQTNVDDSVSYVSKILDVREKMVILQRAFSNNKNIVVEGRDIGSNVFPDADFKFFLIADVMERAKRRFNDQGHKKKLSILELVEKIKKRDKIDSNRLISPLIKVDDAIEINTTSLTIEEQVTKIYDIIIEVT